MGRVGGVKSVVFPLWIGHSAFAFVLVGGLTPFLGGKAGGEKVSPSRFGRVFAREQQGIFFFWGARAGGGVKDITP